MSLSVVGFIRCRCYLGYIVVVVSQVMDEAAVTDAAIAAVDNIDIVTTVAVTDIVSCWRCWMLTLSDVGDFIGCWFVVGFWLLVVS